MSWSFTNAQPVTLSVALNPPVGVLQTFVLQQSFLACDGKAVWLQATELLCYQISLCGVVRAPYEALIYLTAAPVAGKATPVERHCEVEALGIVVAVKFAHVGELVCTSWLTHRPQGCRSRRLWLRRILKFKWTWLFCGVVTVHAELIILRSISNGPNGATLFGLEQISRRGLRGRV